MKQTGLGDFNWRYIANTRRYLLVAVVCGLMGVVMLTAVAMPQFNKILSTQAKLTQEKKTLGQLQNKAQALNESQTLDLVNEAQLINSALPSHKPLLELMTSLNFVASWAQVSITDIQLSPGEISTDSAKTAESAKVVKTTSTKSKKVALKNYKNLDVDLTVEGSLDKVNLFLKNLENTVPFSTVTQFTLSEIKGRATSDTNPDVKNYRAELTISTYYFTQSINAALAAPLSQVGNDEQSVLAKLKSYTVLNQAQQKEIQGGGSQDLFGVNSLTN